MVSDVTPDDLGHETVCKNIILGVNDELTVDIFHSPNLNDDVVPTAQQTIRHALENGYAVVSRSTTGLSDADQDEGQDMLDNGGIVVHAHGSNGYYEEIDLVTSVDAIVSVRDVDGSYGLGSEFTLTEAVCQQKTSYSANYKTESYTTALMAGVIADYGYRYPALTYTQIRQVIRDNSSNGGVWQEITGYGTPDWDAIETALSEM